MCQVSALRRASRPLALRIPLPNEFHCFRHFIAQYAIVYPIFAVQSATVRTFKCLPAKDMTWDLHYLLQSLDLVNFKKMFLAGATAMSRILYPKFISCRLLTYRACDYPVLFSGL